MWRNEQNDSFHEKAWKMSEKNAINCSSKWEEIKPVYHEQECNSHD